MDKITTLTKENFTEKQLAEQKGGLYTYQEYREGSRAIVIRIYPSTYAVDYYSGKIDLEDSDFGDYSGDAWPQALEVANRFFTEYAFSGVPTE